MHEKFDVPAALPDSFVASIKLSAKTVHMRREVFPANCSERAVANLACIALGCASDKVFRRYHNERVGRYRKARASVIRASQTLSTFMGIEAVTLRSTMAQLQLVAESLQAKIDQSTPKGRRPAINKRTALHAIAALFRRYGMPVTVNDNPASHFVRLSHCLLHDVGISGGVDSVADAALKAQVLHQYEADKSWSYESGGHGIMVGTTGLPPMVMGFNADASYAREPDGGFRLTLHYQCTSSGKK